MASLDVQNHIIARLKNADTLRYRDMRPDETPNDLFNYHLKVLIAKKIVEKTNDGYRLTPYGVRQIADTFNSSDPAHRHFKIAAIAIASRLRDGKIQIVNQRRTAQPTYGTVGAISGAIVKGEAFIDGAARKLQEETGLTAQFRLLGVERRRLYKQEELYSDVLFAICYASETHGMMLEKTVVGENFWVDIDEAIKNESRPFDSIQAITKVLEHIRAGTIGELPFFCDEAIQKEV